MALTDLPYAQRAAEIERQRRYAELLQQQAAEPLQSQMVGGRVVPISPWLGLAKMLQAGIGGYYAGKAGKAEAELDTQQREEAKKSIQDFMAASGPQKAWKSEEAPAVETRPLEYTDFQNEAEYEAYRNSPDYLKPQMVKPTQWSDETGQYEPVYNWTETTKPGLSRNEQIAKLLEMQMSGNKYVSAAVPTLSALAKGDEEEYGTPFESGGKMYTMSKSGNVKSLDLAAPTKEKTEPSDIQAYKFAKDQGYTGSFIDYQNATKGGTKVSVSLPPAQSKYAEKVGTSLAEREDATLTASETAPEQIASSQRVKALLQQNPITGAGANIKTVAKKTAIALGLADENDSEIVATDKLITELAKGTLSAVKSSGLGAGNGFTDKDLAFLEKATTGNVELSSKTLEYLAEKNERAAREAIKKGNAIRARRRSMPEFQGLGGAFEDIPMPAEYNPTSSYGTPPAGAVRPRG